MKKRPGRPLSQASLEKRRIDAMLKNKPSHLPQLTEVKKLALERQFQQSEKIRLEILKSYKHGRTTPDAHAYAMASIGDESLIGYEQVILDADDKYARRAKHYRDEGTRTTKNKSATRQEIIRSININLISKIQTSSAYSVYRVAKIIYDQWDLLLPAQKLLEEISLKRRGDGGIRPSITTIGRWIST